LEKNTKEIQDIYFNLLDFIKNNFDLKVTLMLVPAFEDLRVGKLTVDAFRFIIEKIIS